MMIDGVISFPPTTPHATALTQEKIRDKINELVKSSPAGPAPSGDYLVEVGRVTLILLVL